MCPGILKREDWCWAEKFGNCSISCLATHSKRIPIFFLFSRYMCFQLCRRISQAVLKKDDKLRWLQNKHFSTDFTVSTVPGVLNLSWIFLNYSHYETTSKSPDLFAEGTSSTDNKEKVTKKYVIWVIWAETS